MLWTLVFLTFRFVDLLIERWDLVAENLALRHQVAVLKRSVPRPRLTTWDRLYWSALAELWPRWRDALAIVSPATVIRWHRQAFKLFWTWKSSRGPGRPGLDPALRALIKTLALANPTWGAPRIHGELLKLGFKVSQRTVSSRMPRRPGNGQSWATFLENHMHCTVAADFFVAVTVGFKIVYGFVVLDLERRRIRHVAATSIPTAVWTAQQFTESFPWDTAPRFVIHDRDPVFGYEVRKRLRAMGVRELRTAPRSPRQNAFVERVIGSLRRDLLDHVIVRDQVHLARLLHAYQDYYNNDRTHLSLAKDCPVFRPVRPRPTSTTPLAVKPKLGGLHHRYDWAVG